MYREPTDKLEPRRWPQLHFRSYLDMTIQRRSQYILFYSLWLLTDNSEKYLHKVEVILKGGEKRQVRKTEDCTYLPVRTDIYTFLDKNKISLSHDNKAALLTGVLSASSISWSHAIKCNGPFKECQIIVLYGSKYNREEDQIETNFANWMKPILRVCRFDTHFSSTICFLL